MSTYAPHVLKRAVAAICTDIQSRTVCTIKPDERDLWWELSSCILSSQVPYSLAIAFSDVIDEEGLLLHDSYDTKTLMQRLIVVLRTPRVVEGQLRTYRFPAVRASQLAAARTVIMTAQCSLCELVGSFQDATEARAWLVKHVPGIGPKQASMFLRNIGISYDLAVLDRHVLNYMSKLNIYSGTNLFISNLTQYCKYEAILREHAQALDCSVGILDWAIWIVMRVANRNMEAIAT